MDYNNCSPKYVLALTTDKWITITSKQIAISPLALELFIWKALTSICPNKYLEGINNIPKYLLWKDHLFPAGNTY